MRIKLISDIHFEFHQDNGKEFISSLDNNCDVLIIAGDLCDYRSLEHSINLISKKFSKSKILYVLGNHEYYNGGLFVLQEAKDICKNLSNISLLENDIVEINGQRFLGCTGWFKHSGKIENSDIIMNDFFKIKDIYDWIHKTYNRSLHFIKTELKDGDIVITHHLPHNKCIHPRYRGSELNRYFANEGMKEFCENGKCKLWCFGHTHTSRDLNIDGTRLLCNPFGYVGFEMNTGFNESLIIDI